MSQGGSRKLFWMVVWGPRMVLVVLIFDFGRGFADVSEHFISVRFPTPRDVLGRFLVRFESLLSFFWVP